MANELNSFSGRPRFLLVPAKHYEGKPLLVVQAEGAAPNVQAFGPLRLRLSLSVPPPFSLGVPH